jgi:CBS domain-containing protein
MHTKVRDVLANKGREVHCVQHTDTIDDVVVLMNDKHIGAVVVKEGEAVVGILTERDLLKKLLAAHKDPGKTYACQIMTDQMVITTVDHTCEECMAIMTNHRIRHLPVYDGKELVGIISIGDLMKRLVQDRSTEVHYLQDYINGPYA